MGGSAQLARSGKPVPEGDCPPRPGRCRDSTHHPEEQQRQQEWPVWAGRGLVWPRPSSRRWLGRGRGASRLTATPTTLGAQRTLLESDREHFWTAHRAGLCNCTCGTPELTARAQGAEREGPPAAPAAVLSVRERPWPGSGEVPCADMLALGLGPVLEKRPVIRLGKVKVTG